MKDMGGKPPINMANFKRVTTSRHHGRVPVETDAYVISGTATVRGISRPTATLSLSRELTDIITERIGPSVSVFVDTDGRLLLITAPLEDGTDARRVNQGGRSVRSTVSMNGMHDAIVRMYGEHRKVHFEAEVYEGVVLLRPTGEVE